MNELTIALAKGRLADQSVELLVKCGIDYEAFSDLGRKLVIEDSKTRTRFLLANVQRRAGLCGAQHGRHRHRGQGHAAGSPAAPSMRW